MIDCLGSIVEGKAEGDSYLLSATLDVLNSIVQHQPTLLSQMQNESQVVQTLVLSVEKFRIEPTDMIMNVYTAQGANKKYPFMSDPLIFSYVQLNERLSALSTWIQLYETPTFNQMQNQELLAIQDMFALDLMWTFTHDLLDKCTDHVDQLRCGDQMKMNAQELFIKIFNGIKFKCQNRSTQLLTFNLHQLP